MFNHVIFFCIEPVAFQWLQCCVLPSRYKVDYYYYFSYGTLSLVSKLYTKQWLPSRHLYIYVVDTWKSFFWTAGWNEVWRALILGVFWRHLWSNEITHFKLQKLHKVPPILWAREAYIFTTGIWNFCLHFGTFRKTTPLFILGTSFVFWT